MFSNLIYNTLHTHNLLAMYWQCKQNKWLNETLPTSINVLFTRNNCNLTACNNIDNDCNIPK